MAVATLKDSLTLLKGELTRGTTYGMSEEQQYECAKKTARSHPSLKFEGEESKECHEDKTNSSHNFNAKSFLEKTLPSNVCQQLSPQELDGLSQVMNESAGVEGLGTVVYNSKTDFRQVTEFSVLEHVVDDEEPQIKLHYVKVTAKADCKRYLVFSKAKMELKAEHKVSTFTAQNASLRYGSMADSAIEQSLAFLARNNDRGAVRL